jgi:acetyltransferase-like isoleucine patch superfamily enzyme
MNVLARAFWGTVEWPIANWPGPIGKVLRVAYYRLRLRSLGRNVTFGVGVHITNPEFVSIGDHCWIDDYVSILAGPPQSGPAIQRKPNAAYTGAEGEVTIGANCHIAIGVVLQGHGGLSIGSNITVASGCKIYSLSHHYRNPNNAADVTVYKFSSQAPSQEQFLISSPVVLEDDTAVGLNSVLLPGTIIRKQSWLGTMSLLSGEIPPGMIAAGNPAVPVKPRWPHTQGASK